MRRKLAIILAAVLAAGAVSGCTAKRKESESDDNVVLKYVMPGPGIQRDAERVWEEFNKKLHEKLPNVTVEFEIFPVSEYKQQFMLMQTSREKIDIANVYALDFAAEVKNGTFADVTELIDEYGGDIKKELPEFVFDYMIVNEKLYGIPSYQMISVPGCYVTQKELADKYFDTEGFRTEIYSSQHVTEKMYDYLEDYFKKLKENGELSLGYYPNNSLSTIGYENMYGNFVIDIYDPNCTVYYLYDLDCIRESYAKFSDWFKKGYIRKDILSVQDHNQDLFKKDGYNFWNYNYTPDLAKQQEEKTGIKYEVIARCENKDEGVYIPRTNAAEGTCIMESSEYKKEAMQVINLLQSDKELYNMLVYGIAGEHYTKIDDDTIDTPYDGQATSSDSYGLYKWIIGNTALSYYTREQDREFVRWWKEDINGSQNRSRLIGFIPDTAGFDDKISQINAIKGEYMNSLVSGSLPDWEATYNEWKAKFIAAGVEDVVAELQKQVDKFLADKNK